MERVTEHVSHNLVARATVRDQKRGMIDCREKHVLSYQSGSRVECEVKFYRQ